MLIVSFATTDTERSFEDITRKSHEEYAARIGAEYVNEPTQKVISRLRDEKDCVLFLSPYVMINPKAPDIRKACPEKGIWLFDESRFRMDHSKYAEFVTKRVGEKATPDGFKLYNMEVMFVYPDAFDVFQRAPFELTEDEHSYWLSYVCQKRTDRMRELPFRFNRTMSVERFVGESRFRSNFINYKGLAEELGAAHAVITLAQDVTELAKDVTYKANYMVELSGGLGDIVESEPAVRFLAQKLCPDENIVLVTRVPEVFQHLKLPTYHADVEVPNRNHYLRVVNMGRVEDVFFHFIMPHDTHFADLAAQRMLKRTVPIMERQIQLDPGKEPDIQFDWKNSVILHPGKGWESKTFPGEVWEEYTKTLLRAGYNVVLIGKTIDDKQGFVPVNTELLGLVAAEAGSGKFCDTRDKLNLLELFWVIRNCPVLITNDSAPVHIAGAYDNAIGLIATCKHPDYILPYRNGNPYHKAKSLERRKLYLETRLPPNYIDMATIDHANLKDLLEAAPTPDDVLAFAKEYLPKR